ncbi:MAG TPA: hypothetical protein DCP08_08125 [Chloroflexi bacterium]|nr:hypothetical protein [Chloroflexota bacterium]
METLASLLFTCSLLRLIAASSTQAVKNLFRHWAPFVPPVAPRFWRSPSSQEGKIRGVATLEASAELSIFSL